MPGLRKYPPAYDETWFSDAVDFWGGITAESQICSQKIMLHGAEPTLLSSWQHPTEKDKITPAAIYGGAITNPLAVDLDFDGHQALDMLLHVLASDPGTPLTGQVWYRSDLGKPSVKRATVVDRFVLEDLSQTLTNKTLTTPTIGSFANATHNHQSSAGGGSLARAAISDFAHKALHISGGSDEFADGDLLKATARLIISKAGTLIGTRRQLNLVQGSNVTLTMSDDPTNEKVDVTISSTGGTGGGGAFELHLPFGLEEATYTP